MMFNFYVYLFLFITFSDIFAYPSTIYNEIIQEKQSSINTLRQVNLVLRHGSRSPQTTYTNDPYKNNSMDPFGWGQLTQIGRLEQYNQGLFLRERYGEFLGDNYTPKIFWLQSTAADRAKMSALLEASSLWPPNTKQTFKKDYNWQPVVLNYQNEGQDTLLLIWETCPDYARVRDAILESEDIKNVNENNKNLYDELSHHTGDEIKNMENVFDLYSTLEAEKLGMKFELPKWTEEYYPEKFLNLSRLSLKLNVYNETLIKMKAGPLITKIVTSMKNKKDNTLNPIERKMFMYVGHDSTVASVLAGLNVWDMRIPGYNEMVMIELHEDENDWNVQIYLRNSTLHKPYPLTVPGCEFACPLDKFVSLLKPSIISNEEWKNLCELKDSNYKAGAVPLP